MQIRNAFLALLMLFGSAAFAETMEFEFVFTSNALSISSFNGYDRVQLINAVLPEEDTPGTPWLPAQYVNILLPDNTRAVTCSVTADESLAFTNVLVLPVQPPQPLSMPAAAFTPPDEAVYQGNEKLPTVFAVPGLIHKLRGHSFLSLRLNPIRYIPARRELYLVRRMVLTVNNETLRTVASPAFQPTPTAIFDEMTRGLVINPERLAVRNRKTGGEQPAGGVDYLLITSPAMSNAFQQLANHRLSKNGLSGKIVTTNYIAANYSGVRPDGGTDLQTKIRNCIKANVTDNGTTYVILGGDDTIIPKRGCYVACSDETENSMPTDLYYGGLDGTWDENANGIYGEADYSGALDEGDLAYDVIVARIPVRTATQATDYINKLIRFETVSITTGFSHKIFIGGDMLWNSYTGNDRPADLVNDGRSEFRSHTPVSDAEIWGRRMWRDGIRAYDATTLFSQFHDTLTSWDGGTSGDYLQNAANVITKLNLGWNQVSFNTHGGYTSWSLESGSFGSGSAAALTNTTAIVYTMACLTGGFDGAEPCLSEAFLRNPNGGALVYMGCSRFGWGSPGSYNGGPSFDYEYAFYKQLYNVKRSTAGIAFAEHKLSQIGACGVNNAPRWIQFGLNLQGEPLAPLFRPDKWLGNDPFWFKAVALTNNVMLRWPDPNTCGLSNKIVNVRYHASRYPTNTTDGTQIYQGVNQVYEHTGLTPGDPYYYSIWVSQDGVNFIAPP